MNAGLRALLTGLIDYAGLFPPAKLPMDQAVRNYLLYRDEPEAWMLGRFICPTARLDELARFQDEIEADRPMVVSQLARGGDDRAALEAFSVKHRHRGRFRIDTIEHRVPVELIRSPGGLPAWVRGVIGGETENIFFEIPRQTYRVRAPIAAIRAVSSYGPILGCKIRCAAPEAGLFPPASRWIAEVLVASVAEVLPLKATAGLHHPFPQVDEVIGSRMHGFINLFVAGVLVWCRGIGAAQAEAVLDDNNPASFQFSDEGLRWRELSVTTAEIRQARASAVLSFGSCSFDEPRDDLRALGWL